jgi:hypothetical protein
MISDFTIYLAVITICAFAINMNILAKRNSEYKNLNSENWKKIFLWVLISYCILFLAMSSIEIIYSLIIDFKLWWSEITLSNEAKLLYQSLFLTAVVLKNIVIFIFFKKLYENLNIDSKTIWKYFSYAILWIATAEFIAIVWLVNVFSEMAK